MYFLHKYLLTLSLPDHISNSPNCLTYKSYNVSLENLVWDQLSISKLIFSFFLITCLVDTVLILLEEILSWSLMGVTGLTMDGDQHVCLLCMNPQQKAPIVPAFVTIFK